MTEVKAKRTPKPPLWQIAIVASAPVFVAIAVLMALYYAAPLTMFLVSVAALVAGPGAIDDITSEFAAGFLIMTYLLTSLFTFVFLGLPVAAKNLSFGEWMVFFASAAWWIPLFSAGVLWAIYTYIAYVTNLVARR